MRLNGLCGLLCPGFNLDKGNPFLHEFAQLLKIASEDLIYWLFAVETKVYCEQILDYFSCNTHFKEHTSQKCFFGIYFILFFGT